MFHRCPAKRHTHYDAPSNGTFVASNVRTQECTPSRKAEILALHDAGPACLAVPRNPSYIGEVYNAFDNRDAASKSTMLQFRSESTPHYPQYIYNYID